MAHVIRVLAEAEDKIANERPFRTRIKKGQDDPSLSAGPWVTHSYGFLPKRLHDDVAGSRYVVWSYDTPIAWVRQDGTNVVPNVGYSPTTGQHQAMARTAWGLPHMWRDPEPREVVKIPTTDVLYGKARRLRSGGLDG